MYNIQVENPYTHEIVNLYSDEINELLSNGVKETDIVHWHRITPSIFNRNTVFVDDVLYNIMLNTDLKHLQNLCTVDKSAMVICHDGQFWKDKIVHDGYLLFNEPWKMEIDDYIEIRYITLSAKKLLEKRANDLTLRNPNGKIIQFNKTEITQFLPIGIIDKLNIKDNEKITIRFRYIIDKIIIVKVPTMDLIRFSLTKKEIEDTIVKAMYYNFINV